MARLTTYGDNDGAIPGSYQVTIRKTKTEGNAPPADPNAPSPMTANPNAFPPVTLDLLPKRFAAPATSGLQATVSEKGQNSFDFPLAD
jgi:hypothetical protein